MSSSRLKDAAIIATVSGITTLNVFLSGALTVALPAIGRDLNFKQADLQWPVNVFNLSYGCMVLFFGRLGDIFGGKPMFLAGSAWFGIWSLAAAFAQNHVAFILFVAFKGLGAAANTPAGVSLFVHYFPPGPTRNRAFGILGAGQPIGFILGLVLGGLLVESSATWRCIFYIQTGLAGLLVALGLIVLDNDKSDRTYYSKGLDWGGAILSTSGVGLLTYSLADSTSAPRGWANPRIIALACVSLVLLIAFWYYEVWRENRDLSVLMPPRMWRQKKTKLKAFIAMVFFAWWNFNVLTYFTTLYFQQVNLLTPIQTSVRFIPMVIAGFIVNLAGGLLMSHVPSQILVLFGLCGSIVSPILLATINVNGSYWTTVFWVMILVVGVDIAYPIGSMHLSSAFGRDSQALAGGIFSVATRLGTSIGIAVTSSIATAITQKYAKIHNLSSESSPEALMVGYRAGAWTLLAVGLLAFGIALVGLRGIGYVGQKRDKVDGDNDNGRTPSARGEERDGGNDVELSVIEKNTEI
ncbi:MFS general substrate transporter [Dendrothele bispora CBS 962.96]|uniref:MFS general substrate transporter n=1 Tax=Dendrothele bispora (strain CBS 962.96) TaxID=1314807 RepID=A0A4S8MF43_DENBC|nr:MFS general substrate transporter [Dendrothele bispora CBS 962.96]